MDQLKTETDLSLLQKENLRLKRGIEELSVLNEIATAINSSLSLNDTTKSSEVGDQRATLELSGLRTKLKRLAGRLVR